MAHGAKAKEFELAFEGHATATGKMRNDITVTWPDRGETFELATDEGGFHGGDGTAPPPLALFVAGLSGCLMTQIRVFSKRLDIDVTGIRLVARCHWKGVPNEDMTYTGLPVAFALDVDLDSNASIEDQKRLITAAQSGCFIEGTLREPCSIGHRLKSEEGWVEL